MYTPVRYCVMNLCTLNFVIYVKMIDTYSVCFIEPYHIARVYIF